MTQFNPPPVAGIHHVTAIASDPQKNLDFYVGALGLRLVTLTVNFDDPSSYHLYYGDRVGTPGTILTFFAWPAARPGRAGAGQFTHVSLAIPAGSLPWWRNRLAAWNVEDRATQLLGDQMLLLEDPDRLPLALVEVAGDPPTSPWSGGSVPLEHAIRGVHAVTLTQVDERRSAAFLRDSLGYRQMDREGPRVRFQAAGGIAPARRVDILNQPVSQAPRMGTGQIHHVAFRAADVPRQAAWLDALRHDGHNVSSVMDRRYFHSIYFREPGGALFEIATDGPGFPPPDTRAGESIPLALPSWLEPQRGRIVAALPPLRLPEPVTA